MASFLPLANGMFARLLHEGPPERISCLLDSGGSSQSHSQKNKV